MTIKREGARPPLRAKIVPDMLLQGALVQDKNAMEGAAIYMSSFCPQNDSG